MRNRNRVEAAIDVPPTMLDHPADPRWHEVASNVLSEMGRLAETRGRRVFGRPEICGTEHEGATVRLTFVADTEPVPR